MSKIGEHYWIPGNATHPFLNTRTGAGAASEGWVAGRAAVTGRERSAAVTWRSWGVLRGLHRTQNMDQKKESFTPQRRYSMKLRWQLGASRVLLRDSADLTRQWNCVSPFICYFSDTFTIDDMTASTAVTADTGLCSIICVYDIIYYWNVW